MVFERTTKCRTIELYESGKYQGTISLYKGLPQDSVLNLLLFNSYVKGILLNVPPNCKVVQFADYIVVFCQNRFPEIIYSSLVEAFDRINSWLLSINLELSVSKTQFIIFNRVRKRTFSDHLDIRENSIIRLNSVKYLSIKLDARLRWREHIIYLKFYLKFKIAKYLNILKWSMGRS